MPNLKPTIAVAACLFELNGSAPTEFRVVPLGPFRAKDGRPHNLPGWNLSHAAGQALLAALQNGADDFLIDFDHQTLHTKTTGQKAPAAGWVKRSDFELREDGIYALNVQWTDEAQADIAAKRYRYVSPVIAFDQKTGTVTAVLMAALVNYAAIDGLSDLAAAHFDLFNPDEDTMKLKEALIVALGAAVDASDEDLINQIAALKNDADKVDALSAEIGTLKQAQKDTAQMVPLSVVTELQTQLAELSGEIVSGKVDKLIQANLAKLPTPGLQAWAAKQSFEALSAYLETAPEVAALIGMQTTSANVPKTEVAALSSEELEVAKQMGISADELKKSKEVA